MKDRKFRKCYMCGQPSYGHQCKKCYFSNKNINKGAKQPLARTYTKRRNMERFKYSTIMVNSL